MNTMRSSIRSWRAFTNVNAACIIPGIVLLALLAWWLRRDLSILDVISLGREQAISPRR